MPRIIFREIDLSLSKVVGVQSRNGDRRVSVVRVNPGEWVCFACVRGHPVRNDILAATDRVTAIADAVRFLKSTDPVAVWPHIMLESYPVVEPKGGA